MTDGQQPTVGAALNAGPVEQIAGKVAAIIGCVVALASSGCFAHVATAQEEQRSTAEYDIANDARANGRLREAYDHVQKSLKLNPDNPDAAHLGALILIGFCALDEKSPDCRLKEAEAFTRKALENAPENRDAKNTLGVILVHEKRYDEAIAVLKPLTEDLVYVSPETAWGNLGWAFFERGSVDEAIDALQRAVAVQPLFCVGQYRLGLAYEKKGDLPQARDAYTKAVDIDMPQCKRLQDAFGHRAEVLAKQGHKDEARSDFQRCRDLDPRTAAGQKCASRLQIYQ